MLRKLKLRSLQADDNGLVMLIAAIIIMLLAIWLIATIAGAIIPLAIFMILAIVLITLVKKVLFGGESLGVTKAIFGFGREAGKETIGVMKGAGREYEQFRERRRKPGGGML